MVATDKAFQIHLKSNPTTGFQWRMAKQEKGSAVRLLESKYITPQSKKIGAPGRTEFTLIAEQTGESNIVFELSRPWERELVPEKIATFRVIVR